MQKIVKEGPSIYRGSQKIVIQEFPRSIPKELSDKHQCRASSRFKMLLQGHLEEDFSRISTRSSHKDLYEIMQGHLEDVTRTYSIASDKVLKIMQRPLTAFH